MIFVKRISLIFMQIETSNDEEKFFYKIYWNQIHYTGEEAGETCAFVYAKPTCLVMKSYSALSELRQS